jgi:hypothetical protein
MKAIKVGVLKNAEYTSRDHWKMWTYAWSKPGMKVQGECTLLSKEIEDSHPSSRETSGLELSLNQVREKDTGTAHFIFQELESYPPFLQGEI